MKIDTRASSEPEAFAKRDAKPATNASGSERVYDVVVLGAGPAGIAAACCAADAGRRVALIDDNPRGGGQIWRHDPAKPPPREAEGWRDRLRRTSVEILSSTLILGSFAPKTLRAESPTGPCTLRFQRLILACGARERFLPFPGWTLPGIFGAGGLQALVKSGYSVHGKKVVVAGSGPLLLAVAAYLRGHGADVRLVAEQAPRSKLLRFGGSLLWHQPSKLFEAMGLRWQLRGVPYRAGCWPIRTDGAQQVTSVTLTDGSRTWTEPCDAVACGFGLVPNLELPMLFVCAIERGFVKVDEHQQTSVAGMYAVGELTGIGGVDKSLIEGQIAGWAAADQPVRIGGLLNESVRARRFSELLDDAFTLRDELRHLADDATIVCRCEDVTYGALKRFVGQRDAKLQTRCGMGPCQGRICGPALQFLFGWLSDSVRPPIFPTALGNLS
ncbi:MAG: NAD(P)/FAD-dependent oxidoreductase [Gemmataceae bacterium]|nr:NAD(P)/FAD-dependent oxidoreductase [Gemmataceae bacterium]